MLVGKQIIIVHGQNHDMCALLRGGALSHMASSGLLGQFDIINSPEVISDEYILMHTVAVLITRVSNERSANMVRHYDKYRRNSKYGLKVYLDFDDLVWDLDGFQSIPLYNECGLKSVDVGRHIESILKMTDGTFVSTPWLSACWEYRFGSKAKVIPNFLPWHLFGNNSMRRIDRDIEKPVVVYGGTPTHYSEGDLGDFAGPWKGWLEEAVGSGAIECHMFGTCPDWLPADKVIVHPKVFPLMWGQALRSINADIYIAPLVDNEFNRCKSDLKYSEACAIGAAMLGSYWEGWCPYAEEHELSRVTSDMTSEGLDNVVRELCKAENYNKVMEHQQKHANAYWLENQYNTDYIMQALCGDVMEINHG